MSEDLTVARYPTRFRHRPITMLGCLLIYVWFAVYSWKLLSAHPADPRMLVVAGILTLLVALVLHHVWMIWFLATDYRNTEESVEQISPVLKKRKLVRFAELQECREFTYGGRRDPQTAYILVGKDGTGIRLMEALPIWPQIVEHLDGVPVKPAPLLQRTLL